MEKKKLKAWQIVLMVIFYPITLTYLLVKLIIKLVKKHRQGQIVKELMTKVVGVTFDNDDGTSRQEVVLSCSPGEMLDVKQCVESNYPTSFGVFKKDGRMLGHISRELADDLYAFYKDNHKEAMVMNITGGGKLTYGCNIRLYVYSK